jgi:ABC-type sugar transport system, periplasmic component
MYKRIVCVFFAILLSVNISACNGSVKKNSNTGMIDMTNVTYYEEKEIGKSIGIKSALGGLSVDSRNRLVVNDGNKYLFIDSSGKKVYEFKCNISSNSSLFTLDSNDNLYTVSRNYRPKTKGEKDRKIDYRLMTYSSKGEKLSNIELGERTVNDKKPGISDIAVDSKGNIYLLSQWENIEVINAEGKKIKNIPAAKIDYIEIDSSDNLILGAIDGGNTRSMVEKRNAKGESLWKKDLVLGDSLQKLKYNSKDGRIYMLCEKGILACNVEGEIQGYVFDSKQSSLLESGTIIMDFYAGINNIYVLALQSNSSSGTLEVKPLIYLYTPLKEGKRPKDQVVLSLALSYSDRFIESAVSKFQKDHPGIRLDIKDYKAAYISTGEGMDQDEPQRAQKAIEDYQRVINTEIMAGKGADIIDVGILPYRKYIDKNAFVNISEMIANDKSFDINKYNPKILNACKYKNNLYILPISFSFTMIGGNKSILQKEGIKVDDTNWTWDEFFKIAQSITKDTNGDGNPDQYGLPKMSGEDVFNYMFDAEQFVDYNKKTSSFNSSKFIKLLKRSKEISDYKIFNPQVDSNKLWDMTDPGTIAFVTEYISSCANLVYAQSLSNGDVLLLNSPAYKDINNKPFMLGRTFAVNNNSKYKNEAWEFLKFLISDNIQASDEFFDFVINLDAQKQKTKKVFEQTLLYDMGKEKGRNIRKLTQTDIDNLDKLVGELGTLSYKDPQVSKIVTDGVKEFFGGSKTAEETASIIENKVSTYLGE